MKTVKEDFDYNRAEIEHADKSELEQDDRIRVLYSQISKDVDKPTALQMVANVYKITPEEVESIISQEGLNEPTITEGGLPTDTQEIDVTQPNSYYFQAGGDIVCVDGLDHPTAQDLAVKILSQFRSELQEKFTEHGLDKPFILTLEFKEDEESTEE